MVCNEKLNIASDGGAYNTFYAQFENNSNMFVAL